MPQVPLSWELTRRTMELGELAMRTPARSMAPLPAELLISKPSIKTKAEFSTLMPSGVLLLREVMIARIAPVTEAFPRPAE